MDTNNTVPASMVPKSGPKDVFMHLLAIVTLYASAVSFIALMFALINGWFPDALDYGYGASDSIRWSASMLIVMFPVYLLVTWLIRRDFDKNPERREIRIRKWLGYLTLFVSAITFIIDVVFLVYNLLGGEVTIRFFFKVLVVLAVAAVIFLYYFFDMRKPHQGEAT
jgi:hypothetical protein